MIDVHCHLEYMDAEKIIAEARQKMSAIITSVADPKDTDKILALRKRYGDFVFVSLGFHPERIEKYPRQQIDEYIKKIKSHKKEIVAIGEAGLDYSRIKDSDKREESKSVFIQFIELSNELKLPLVVHGRNESGNSQCTNDILKILDEAKNNVVLHCFSGSETNLKEALEKNYWISFATLVCKSDKHKRFARQTPLEKMLLETDSPWLHPTSREMINRPWFIEESAKAIAGLKGVAKEGVLEITEENAKTAFKLNF